MVSRPPAHERGIHIISDVTVESSWPWMGWWCLLIEEERVSGSGLEDRWNIEPPLRRMEDRENIFCLLTCFNHATLIIGFLDIIIHRVLHTYLPRGKLTGCPYMNERPSTPDGRPLNGAPEINRGVALPRNTFHDYYY